MLIFVCIVISYERLYLLCVNITLLNIADVLHFNGKISQQDRVVEAGKELVRTQLFERIHKQGVVETKP